MSDNPQLKDMFNSETVGSLAEALVREYPPFPEDNFIRSVFDQGWEELELKARVRRITLVLGELLPGDYQANLDILLNTLPHLGEQGFEKMVFPDYIEVFGLDDPDPSLDAMEEMTKFISAEFAIRPFINSYPEKTLPRMLNWADHTHPGVRRLASEGCRPRLPWGLRLQALVADPTPIIPILEKLKGDPREEIRRSVANNLNDISKDHPDLVVEILSGWRQPDNIERERLIKHALRTLIKAGHPAALGLLGFSSQPKITVSNVRLEPASIKLGEEVVFSFEIHSLSETVQSLMVDYVVHFLKANGTHSPKVFKLKQIDLKAGEKVSIVRKHGIKSITTRRYYPGLQYFQPQVNGQVFDKVELILDFPES